MTTKTCRLMEEPPAVPPKDPSHAARMEVDRPSTAHTSGSKRKWPSEHNTPAGESDLDFSEYEGTPNKRTRSNAYQSDVSASDDTKPRQPRSVRRKRKSHNLSNLNLRHAARAQTPAQGTTRGSKFQEGSLTDRPSDKPPSLFTRLTRPDSGALERVDTLMAEYHDGAPTPPDSAEKGDALVSPDAIRIDTQVDSKEEGKGFFQFGRQLAANFHPMSLWKSIWNDSKDELTREKLEEAERKTKLKADAEVRYAEMKRNGQFAIQPPTLTINGNQSSGEDASTPRDSGVGLDSTQSSLDYTRSASVLSVLRPGADDATDKSASEVPESTSKIPRVLKDRLHIKKSFSNMKSELKRMRSDISLVSARESSSSLSPVKTDFDSSTLRKSASRADLKKQRKLNKRVSDLETKLQQAREELNEAIVEASPMPKLTGKYERFTPSGTIKRPKFVPGKLPSLPSERILMAGISMNEGTSDVVAGAEAEPRKAMDLSFTDFLAGQTREINEDHGEETIKPSRARDYPPRASSLFDLDKNDDSNTENQTPPQDIQDQAHPIDVHPHRSEADTNMDPNSINELLSEAAPAPAKPADYGTLDAKLKALDANVKTARKDKQPKKRKSLGEKDSVFKPHGSDSDDDGEWEKATPKKKRKSTGKTEVSPTNKRSTRGAGSRSSPSGKGLTGAARKSKPAQSSPLRGKETIAVDDAEQEDVDYSTDELAKDPEDDARMGIDATQQPGVPPAVLDPVYEEEEDAQIKGNDASSNKPTQAVALLRSNGRNSTARSRSACPTKRDQPGAEEQLLMRAADAAHKHRQTDSGVRSVSPPPAAGYTKTTTVIKETVSVVLGADGVPALPHEGALGDERLARAPGIPGLSGEGTFEWPDDVF